MRFCLLVLMIPAVGWAQSASTGGLEGLVRDGAGKGAPGVEASLVSRANGQVKTAESDAAGAFRFSLLAPGTYELKLSAAGFKSCLMAEVVVNVSETVAIEAVLEGGECRGRVTAAGTASGTLVDQKTITAVPLNTRNFTQVLSMSSGSAAT